MSEQHEEATGAGAGGATTGGGSAGPKYKGTVKWFSNRKGYGFITPDGDDNCPIEEDIFVHQSVVSSEGYRTLNEGWIVEFAIGNDDDGKAKADDVTAPGGGHCNGPRRPPRRRRDNEDGDGDHEGGGGGGGGGGGEGGEGGGGGGGGGGRNRNRNRNKKAAGDRPPPPPHWHAVLGDAVKTSVEDKGVRTSTGTLDVSHGTYRIKLGTKGYCSLADARGMLAEGTFESDEDGRVTFVWERAIKFGDGGEWEKVDENGGELVHVLMLDDDLTGSVGVDETAETLWGDGPTDPRHALEENEFQMRRVVLTTKRR